MEEFYRPKSKKQEEIVAWLLDKMPPQDQRCESRYKNIDIKGWYKEKSVGGFTKPIPSSGYTLVPIRVLDISETGASIRSSKLTQPGQTVRLNLKLGNEVSEESVTAIECKVLRCINNRGVIGDDCFHIGLRFINMGSEIKRDLLEFLRKAKEKRAA